MKSEKISSIKPDQRNANKGTVEGTKLLNKSLKELGAGRSILADEAGNVIAGNKTLQAAIDSGMEDVIVVETDGTKLVVVKRTDLTIDSPEGRKLALLDNKVSQVNLDFDVEVIESLAVDFDIDLDDIGFGKKGAGIQQNEGGLTKRFIVPPFSILDTRQGYWKERKEHWRTRIGDYGESRNATLRKSKSADDPSYYRQKTAVEQKLGRMLDNAEFEANHYVRSTNLPVGVSLLDPVLAEVVVQWFGIDGGQAFDPFAGDSVFGFVCSASGISFTGIELRAEQADLNQARVDTESLPAKYICADGRQVATYLEPESQDLLFSCPPYFDLEVYSDLENDASNQKTYAQFYQILDEAFLHSVACLKQNRFAVIVVGDIRHKSTGAYYGFHLDIINTMRSFGLHFYNECILIEQAGNAAIRASGQMKHRKVVKTHQQVLVFYKGDPRQIKTHFPEIVYEPEDLESFGMDTDHQSEDAEGGI
ncbi:site-specific DNA-methyltransferase [Spirosoma foliorum]|uniref:Site-specific DNA-methyltransferase n=1 Tax=Spirosoma foliorum TaxID=2710596 RepID=A0A7G5H5J4_9BACT|nr:site-specific DNA-methyltransferase [Spirosoma foliorum]QMW06386.1 site-specific DNA-methyltransferase [Spirosoma foliorum]